MPRLYVRVPYQQNNKTTLRKTRITTYLQELLLKAMAIINV